MNIKRLIMSTVAVLATAFSLVNCGGGGGGGNDAAFISVQEFQSGAKSFYCKQGFRSFAVVPLGDQVNDASPSDGQPNVTENEDEDGNVTQDVANQVGTTTVMGYISAYTTSAQRYECQLTYTLFDNNKATVAIICTDPNSIDDEILIKAMGLNGAGDLDSLKIDVILDFNPGGLMSVKVTGHADLAANDNEEENADADADQADVDEEFTVPFYVHRNGTNNPVLE